MYESNVPSRRPHPADSLTFLYVTTAETIHLKTSERVDQSSRRRETTWLPLNRLLSTSSNSDSGIGFFPLRLLVGHNGLMGSNQPIPDVSFHKISAAVLGGYFTYISDPGPCTN